MNICTTEINICVHPMLKKNIETVKVYDILVSHLNMIHFYCIITFFLSFYIIIIVFFIYSFVVAFLIIFFFFVVIYLCLAYSWHQKNKHYFSSTDVCSLDMCHQYKIYFRFLLFLFKTLHKLSLHCISDLHSLHHTRPLRSKNQFLLSTPRSWLKLTGDWVWLRPHRFGIVKS